MRLVADGPDLELQAALVAYLEADPDLAALVADRIYDQPPDQVATTYVRIGRIDVEPMRTDGRVDWDIIVALEAHSRPVGGRVEAARICGVLVAALEGAEAVLTVPSYPLEWCQFVTQDVSRAPDGASYIGVTVFAVSLSGA